MKRRVLTAVAAFALAFAAILGLGATPALAYDPVNGNNSLNFNKFLIVDENARIPAMTFTYTIASGTAVEATSTTPAIIAGVGTPTIGSAIFTDGDTAYTAVQNGDIVTLGSGKQYAKKVVNVDFRGVSFSQPGIYRYVITENTNADNKAVTYDTQISNSATPRTRYLDVYVEDTNDTLSVSQYVMHETPEITTNANNEATDKSYGFVNEITSHEFTFGKEVTGNQGSKDKYFKFTLTINNAQANTTYAVDTSGADPTPSKTDSTQYDTMTNAATVTTGSHGVVTEYFYLKDGQYITIKGLPDGYMYELSEVAEDYTSSTGIAADNNASSVAHTDPVVNTTGVTADIKTGFTNDRSGTVPTGIILTVAPFAIGLMLFGALTVLFVSKSLRRSV